MLKSEEIDVFWSIGNTGAMFVGYYMYFSRSIPEKIISCSSTIIPIKGSPAIILDDVKTKLTEQFKAVFN